MAKKATNKIATTGQELKSKLDIPKNGIDSAVIWITDLFGSVTFLSICIIALLSYIIWNSGYLSGAKPFDPFPFYALDTVLAIFGIILSITVLISQNRQRRVAKLREQVEFEVNVRAENEITKVLAMLHAIQRKLGIDQHDPELEQMKESIDLEEIHRNAKESEV